MEAKQRSDEVRGYVERLRNNDPALTEVDLSFSDINDGEALMICNAAANNHYITRINFCNNNITDQGAKDIHALLKTHHTIQEVDLAGNTRIALTTLGMVRMGIDHKAKHPALTKSKMVIPAELSSEKRKFEVAKRALYEDFKDVLQYCETFDGGLENMTKETFFTLTKPSLSALESLNSLGSDENLNSDDNSKCSELKTVKHLTDFRKALKKVLKKPGLFQKPKPGTIAAVLRECAANTDEQLAETAEIGQLKFSMLMFTFSTVAIKVNKLLDFNLKFDRDENVGKVKVLQELQTMLVRVEESLMMATALEPKSRSRSSTKDSSNSNTSAVTATKEQSNGTASA